MDFTWIAFYKEFAQKLLQFRNDRTPLVNWIYDNLQGHIKYLKDAPDGSRLPDLDPFTVFAIINRQITYDKKKEICNKLKQFLHISAAIPQDFDGVPEMNNMLSSFLGYGKDRKDGDVERLWRLFEDAVLDKDIQNNYDALKGQFLIKYNITFGLFWIRPDKYLALDGHNREKLLALGIASFDGNFVPYKEYADIMQSLNEKIQSGAVVGCSNYADFSYDAYVDTEGTTTIDAPKGSGSHPYSSSVAYWTFSPGVNASKWQLCLDEGIMCIGWDALGNLSRYSSLEETNQAVKRFYPTEGSAKNDTLAVWQFANEMKPGDVVFAKKGRNKIIGRGVVDSGYMFDDDLPDYKHIRKVKWTDVGEWKSDDLHAMKTLTNVTRYKDYVEGLNNLIEGKGTKEPKAKSTGKQYWWLVANPKIWSLYDLEVGEEQSYSLYNDNGNQRRIFKHFQNAKEGDVVIGYESTPTKQIVGLLVVSKESDGQKIYFKKTEILVTPIDFNKLKNTPGLEDMEYMKNQQGSFFKVTEDEFDVIMEMIREENPLPTHEEKDRYTSNDFLNEVYIQKKDYEQLEGLLLRKKNLILQGAPGVGKTFAAKRLAYAIMGEKDEDRIKVVQFHQNYSYEDFVLGYKPNENGGFDLKEGIFYQFCRKAATDKEHKYFFIIDEINRGNLSKIFGELLMMIEKDYRDTPMQMSYADRRLAVPSNVYLIGMMNTADRSLAMIDYALRRRFSFYEMKPAFESASFNKYKENKHDSRLNKLADALKDLNKIIADDDSLGTGFCIGHSYLCDLGDDYDLESIVEYDIIPMLREYWFDNDERFNSEAQKLRNAIK